MEEAKLLEITNKVLGEVIDELASLPKEKESLREKIINNTVSTIESAKRPSTSTSPDSATRQVNVGVQAGSRDDL